MNFIRFTLLSKSLMLIIVICSSLLIPSQSISQSSNPMQPLPTPQIDLVPNVELEPTLNTDNVVTSVGSQTTVTIPATAVWVNTGITVQAGQELKITATGSWYPGSPASGWIGPNGSALSWPDNFLNLTDIGVCRYCATTQTPFWASLIGYIGDAPPRVGSYTLRSVASEASKIFLVGSNYIGAAPRTGKLWLNFNDDAYSGNVSDNYGYVTATITNQLVRQDLINALASLKETNKSTVLSIRENILDMSVHFTQAVQPELRTLAFQIIIDAISEPGIWGADELVLSRALDIYSKINASFELSVGLNHVFSEIGDNPTEDEIREKISQYFDAEHIFTFPDGRSYVGIGSILDSIDAIYEEQVDQLPNPLPTVYPISSMIREIEEQRAAIEASKFQETFVADYSNMPLQCRFFQLGAALDHKKQVDSLISNYDFQGRVSIAFSVSKAGVISTGTLLKISSLLILPFTAGASSAVAVAAEPIIWGPTAQVLAIESLLSKANDYLQMSTRFMLLYAMFQTNNQSVTDISLAAQSFRDTATWMIRRVDLPNIKNSSNYSVNNPSELSIVLLNTPDILVSDSQQVGVANGSIVIKNDGDRALGVSFAGEIYALLNNNKASVMGIVTNEAPISLQAGEERTVEFTYSVPRSSLVDSTGYKLKVVAAGVDDTGELLLTSPNVSAFFVGTQQQLVDLNKQAFDHILDGTLKVGIPISTSVTTKSETKRVEFTSMGNSGTDFDLHVYDMSGRHTGFNYQTGTTETAIPNSNYIGSSNGPESIILNQSQVRTYKVVLVAINTDGGEGFFISATESPNLPAMLSVPVEINIDEPNYADEIPITIFASEYGGFSAISNISVTASDLTNRANDTIPSSQITFQLPDIIEPSETKIITGTILIGSTLTPSVYIGSVTVSGLSASSGMVVSQIIQIRLHLGYEIFMPSINR